MLGGVEGRGREPREAPHRAEGPSRGGLFFLKDQVLSAGISSDFRQRVWPTHPEPEGRQPGPPRGQASTSLESCPMKAFPAPPSESLAPPLLHACVQPSTRFPWAVVHGWNYGAMEGQGDPWYPPEAAVQQGGRALGKTAGKGCSEGATALPPGCAGRWVVPGCRAQLCSHRGARLSSPWGLLGSSRDPGREHSCKP